MQKSSWYINQRSVFWALLIIALSVAFCPQSAFARRATIVDTKSSRHINLQMVGFRVQGAFTENLTEAIQTGAPTTFTYLIRMFEVVPGMPDKRIFSFQILRTIQYNTLKREYIITSRQDKRWIVKDLVAAEQRMTVLEEVPVALLSSLEKEKEYYVMVKAELGEVQVPWVFSFLRFLVQIWDFETSWTSIAIPVLEQVD